MAKITKNSDRRWLASTFDANVSKVQLYDARSEGIGRSLFTRLPAGHKTPGQWSDAHWDIFVLSGEIRVNGSDCGTGAHVLCMPSAMIEWETRPGAELFIFVRTNHEWWDKKPPPAICISRLGDALNWESSINYHRTEKATLFDGREGDGRSIFSKVSDSSGTQRSAKPWEILVIDGAWDINGQHLLVGDHCLCLPNEEISWKAVSGTALVCFR